MEYILKEPQVFEIQQYKSGMEDGWIVTFRNGKQFPVPKQDLGLYSKIMIKKKQPFVAVNNQPVLVEKTDYIITSGNMKGIIKQEEIDNKFKLKENENN